MFVVSTFVGVRLTLCRGDSSLKVSALNDARLHLTVDLSRDGVCFKVGRLCIEAW